MQFARTAVVIEPVGDVAVLLHLDQADPGADRVDRVRGDVEEVPRADIMPFQQFLDAAVQRGGAHRGGIDRLAETDGQARARFGGDHQPAFLLALPPLPGGQGLRIRRVDLHGQRLAGEDVLDQQCGQFSRWLEPDLADRFARGGDERCRQLSLAPWLGDHPGRQ